MSIAHCQYDNSVTIDTYVNVKKKCLLSYNSAHTCAII